MDSLPLNLIPPEKHKLGCSDPKGGNAMTNRWDLGLKSEREVAPISRLVFASALSIILLDVTAAAQGNPAKPRVTDIVWPESGAISVSASTGDRLKEAERTLLPVLVPKPFLAYQSLELVGEPLQYSASIQEFGATTAITGTRIAIDAEGPQVAGGDEFRSATGDKTAEAAFNRYGAAYLVTVECETRTDKRCATAAYALALARSVELIGGTRDGAPPAPSTPAPPSGDIPVSSNPNFQAEPPGQLLQRSGSGVQTATVYAPGIRFPVSSGPVYLNSQVWGIGGFKGPPGGWSDPRNYKYPWRDNFCELRQYKTPMCPAGSGHQGVDIRPSRPKNEERQMAVAAEPGRIAKIGSYSITLAGDSGSQYNYLHTQKVGTLKVGNRVNRGDAIGLISNVFGGTPTTYHLHFEIKQNRNGMGWVHVPPYSSLVAAYERM